MPRRKLPKYSLHRASGQARVCLDGRDRYLGPYNSPESKEQYRTLVERWQLRQRARRPVSLTIGQLVLLYDAFARGYYVKNGAPTSEPGLIKLALRPLVASCLATPVCDFGPRDLKAVRAEMVAAGQARGTVNGFVRRIVRMFRWAVSEEYCPADVLQALQAVDGLRKGRTAAREPDPIAPVPPEQVEAVLKEASPQVGNLIRLQLLTGCRPGELLLIRACDVSQEGDVWEYVPPSHKTESITAGVEGSISGRRLGRSSFRTSTAAIRRLAASPPPKRSPRVGRGGRRRETRPPCGNRAGTNRKEEPKIGPSDRWTVCAYRGAIHDACDRAGVPRWSPNRLRHSRATKLRRLYGIEAARTVLGHASLGTTEIYAEANYDVARRIMGEAG